MAIQFINPDTFLTRITGLIQGSVANSTWIVWFRPDTDADIDYQTIVAYESATAFAGVYSDSIDNNFNLSVDNDVTTGNTSNITLTAGKWYPFAYTKNAGFHLLYARGLTVGSVTPISMAGVTFTGLFLGTDGAGKNRGSFKGFREWTATLTPTQLLREFNSQDPVHLTGLVTNTPLVANLLDTTINNNDWTTTGVEGVDYNFIEDDPIQAGSTVDEAIDMGTLPYSTTIDVKPTDVEFLFDKFYKYTAQAPEIYIGGFFLGNLTTYTPNYTIYSDAGITPYPPASPIAAQNLRFQMPVIVPHTYYFGVEAQFTNLSYSTLTIDFLTAPRETVPAGSYMINDDHTPFYSAILSSTPGDDYHVLRFIQFVNTLSDWAGDVSNNNRNIFVSDDSDFHMKLYSPTLLLLVDTGLATSGTTKVRKTASGESFYVGELLAVNRVSKVGVVEDTWNLTGTKISALAANDDETILYVAVTNVANAPVKRWDLVNSVYLTDLTAGIALYFVTDMIVLSDDSILVLHVRNGFDVNVHRYDPTGTLLNTYACGAASTCSLSYDFADSDNYFLVRLQDLDFAGQSIIRRVKLSDGSTTQVAHVRYEDGIYDAAKTLTPIAKFGISISCPFFPMELRLTAGGIYKLTPNSSQYEPRRNDKLWLDVEAKTTEEVKIPDPFIETGAIGD